MKKSIISISLFLAFCFVSFNNFAQCIEPPSYITPLGCPFCYFPGGSGYVGSSFLSCMEGDVMKIGIRFNNANIGDANAKLIFRDVLLPGAPGTVGAVNEHVQIVNIAAGGGLQEFNLTPPFPVMNGVNYAWFIESNVGNLLIEGADENPYPNGGTMNGFSNSPNEMIDLVFQVTIGPTTPIPTLSQHGIIALGMIMLILGVVGVRNRKVIFG